MMMNAQIHFLALITFAKILVKCLMHPVEKKRCAQFPRIDPFVNVQLDGLEILMLSASLVGFICVSLQKVFVMLLKLPFLFLDECSIDNDCPFSKECRNQECVDPCGYISCGSQALCKAENHIGICYCPQGMQGNPIVNCVDVGCQHDDDCSTTERCDRGTGKCLPLCVGNSLSLIHI